MGSKGGRSGLESVEDISCPEEAMNSQRVRMCDVIFVEDREPIKR